MPPSWRVEVWVNDKQVRPATHGLVMHTLDDVQRCITEQLEHLGNEPHTIDDIRFEVSHMTRGA